MPEDYNVRNIAEFRSNHGKVGGYFEGKPLLLINTTGARTGRLHVVPVMYFEQGPTRFVFASQGGAPDNPDWYYNLKAHPDVIIEVGDDKLKVHADEVKGAERNDVYSRWSKLYPQFADYEKKTRRTIPVMALTQN